MGKEGSVVGDGKARGGRSEWEVLGGIGIVEIGCMRVGVLLGIVSVCEHHVYNAPSSDGQACFFASRSVRKEMVLITHRVYPRLASLS